MTIQVQNVNPVNSQTGVSRNADNSVDAVVSINETAQVLGGSIEPSVGGTVIPGHLKPLQSAPYAAGDYTLNFPNVAGQTSYDFNASASNLGGTGSSTITFTTGA
jgi:hypothetical protein